MRKTGKRILSFILALSILFSFVPKTSFASTENTNSPDGDTMPLSQFVTEVVKNNGTYNGPAITVLIEPASGCRQNHDEHKDLQVTENTPERIQSYDDIAYTQYQRFKGINNVSISNVTFKLVKPETDIKFCGAWNTTQTIASKDKLDAELQFENTGSTTFSNCTFDNVAVSPISSKTSVSFDNCTFSGLGGYAIKDVQAATVSITNSNFTDCSGGVYMNGGGTTQTTYTDNTFSNIGKRGAIQFGAAGDYSNTPINITGNSFTAKSNEESGFLRQLNSSITSAILDPTALKQNNTFSGNLFLPGTDLTETNTIYVDPANGENGNAGTSAEKPVKTFSKAMELVNAGGTIEVMGDLGYALRDFIINKPVTIEGYGTTRIPISGSVTLPTVNGKVTFRNLSFDGASTFNAYGSSDNYQNLDLVIDDCAFTQASGNCVYIMPEINSLTVTNCDFTALKPEKGYQKQYLIWPYQAKTITIQHNTFKGNGITRAAIHLGEGHPDGTTAAISDNIINGFERGVQLAFTTTDVQNNVTITNNEFNDISLSQITESKPYEVATVFIHENLNNNTKVSYNGNKLTGTSQTMFYSENQTLSPDSIITSFTGNKIGDTSINTPADSWRDPWVAQVGSTKYKTLGEAITAAMNGSDKTITLLSDITVDSWNMIWNIEGITLDGNGHTLKVNAIESGQNHDAVFHSAGGNTFKNLTVDLSGVQSNSQAQGSRAFSAAAGDTFDTITIIGNEHIAYGITTGGTSTTNETITIKNCTIKDCGYAIYDAEDSSVENLIITESTISGCNYATILRAANGQFTDNTVTSGKLNIMSENQIVNENTFTNASTIKFYAAPKSFEKNNISKDSALTCDSDLSATINVANNYWGGGAPSATQIPENLKDKITGSDVYYTAPTMQPEDLNTYEPPYTGKYSYEITVAKTENGSVSVDKYATEGEEVTITVTPDKAFKLDELSVTAGGKDVEITNNGDSTYTFTMPSSKVTITASFIEDEDYVEPTPDPNMPFTDVSENDWFYGAVQYVYDNDMMNGVSDTSFAPNSNLTRAMMAAVLYNLEDQPTQADSTFTDVVEGSWYADAVNWAAANDIVSGYGDGIFGPNDNITREQMAAILYRYAEYKGYDVSAVGDLSQFNDADNVSEWANEVMSWAVGAGLINGMGDGSVAPQGTATRAQVATVLMNFCENIAK